MRTRLVRIPLLGAIRIQPVANMIECARTTRDVLIGFVPGDDAGWRAYPINQRKRGWWLEDSSYEHICDRAHEQNRIANPDVVGLVTRYHHTPEALERCIELGV